MLKTNGDEFIVQLSDIMALAKNNVREVVDRTVISLFTQIVMKSPVDTGNFRANWNFSFGTPDTSTKDARGAGMGAGDESVGKMRSEIAASPNGATGRVSWLSNGLPYAAVLEYGGYPNPPKKGSYIPGRGYVILSEGGFSRQAPHGMVRVTLESFDDVLKVAAQEVRAGA